MEGLGVGSGGVLWPCLAMDTCPSRDRSSLGLPKAFADPRTNAFEFMSEVCLSAAIPRSYFLNSCSFPRTTTGSLPASRRDGQPPPFLHAASARWPRVGKGGDVPCRIGLKQRDRTQATRVRCGAAAQTCYRELQPDSWLVRRALMEAHDPTTSGSGPDRTPSAVLDHTLVRDRAEVRELYRIVVEHAKAQVRQR